VRDLEFPLCTVYDPLTVSELWYAHEILSLPTGDALERETRALEALVHLFQRHGVKRAPVGAVPCRKAVAPVRDLIVREYRRVIRLDELARISGYSKYKLIAAFRAAYGQPPYELVVTLRVAEARRRIARGEPIAGVAADVGFTDQSHLARHFKRIVGVTPGQYARAFN
jgi:AraC-like DNA-binding protein